MNPNEILDRHYKTIGIHDVFLSPAPHLLLSTYLKEGCNNKEEGFDSWEIVGDIKSTPEDFVVREIFPKHKSIPGLSDTTIQSSLRVADLIDPSKLEQQTLIDDDVPAKKSKGETEPEPEPETETTKESGKPIDDAKIFIAQKEDDSNLLSKSELLCPLMSVLEKYMQRTVVTNENVSTAADIVASLQRLHRIAQERINIIAKGGTQPVNLESDIVWIPPSHFDSAEQSKLERGQVFVALKTSFPLLKTNSVTRNETEKWIQIVVDGSCDDLIKYLYRPVKDLSELLLFQKRGVEWAKDQAEKAQQTQKEEVKGLGDARDSVDGAKQIILVLRSGISKEERRKIHHLIASNCKNFATNTITDFPLPIDGESQGQEGPRTTDAIVVSWQKYAMRKGGRKRKRSEKNQSKDGLSSSTKYPNLLFVIRKRQKEHLAMIQRLTQVIHCRQSDIGLAGIKDMQAVTYQYCTIRNIKTQRVMSKVSQLQSHGIELGNFFRVDWMFNNGDLEGNKFEIRIRNLKRIGVHATDTGPASESLIECGVEHMKFMVDRIQKEGFINFFGTQRLGAAGESGASAFRIGKAMLQQNFGLAVDLLMVGRTVFNGTEQGEGEPSKRVRKIWKESGDPSATLKALGSGDLMPRERAVLKGLNRYGKDKHLQALKCLAHSVRMFWINAYQSYVWNQVASQRIEKYGTKIIMGDLYVDKDSQSMTDIKVVQDENIIPSLSLDQVVLPLPGFKISYPENDIGQLYQTLLDLDGVKFEKSAPQEATAKGSYRRLIVQPGTIDFQMNAEEATVDLKFQLPKGSYATMLLREMMLTTATRHTT